MNLPCRCDVICTTVPPIPGTPCFCIFCPHKRQCTCISVHQCSHLGQVGPERDWRDQRAHVFTLQQISFQRQRCHRCYGCRTCPPARPAGRTTGSLHPWVWSSSLLDTQHAPLSRPNEVLGRFSCLHSSVVTCVFPLTAAQPRCPVGRLHMQTPSPPSASVNRNHPRKRRNHTPLRQERPGVR